MKQARTQVEAERAVEAAGYRVSTARTWYDAALGIGYVFSVEGDRACYGHPLMEVRFEQPTLPAPPRGYTAEAWARLVAAEEAQMGARLRAGLGR